MQVLRVGSRREEFGHRERQERVECTGIYTGEHLPHPPKAIDGGNER